MNILGFSYSDLMKMTVMERRYWIGLKRKEHERIEEEQEKGGTKKGNGTTTLSGEAAKKVIASKSINGKIIPGL